MEKKPEKCQNQEGFFFQILTHDNYEETNGIQLDFFTQVLCWECYSKELSIIHFKDHNLQFKS